MARWSRCMATCGRKRIIFHRRIQNGARDSWPGSCYNSADALQNGRKAYWQWFNENFSAQQAVEAVEEATFTSMDGFVGLTIGCLLRRMVLHSIFICVHLVIMIRGFLLITLLSAGSNTVCG